MSRALPEEEFWTTKEVARYLRVGTHTIWLMCSVPPEKGGPPVQRIYTGYLKSGKKQRAILRFPRKKFMSWVAKGGNECSA